VGLPEGLLAEPLKAIQERYPALDVGSYPFYRPTGNGVTLVAKGVNGADAEAAVVEITAMISGFGKTPVSGEPADLGGSSG
jgi:molybdopterin-biosynthesis enzyme MoeA-like protein